MEREIALPYVVVITEASLPIDIKPAIYGRAEHRTNRSGGPELRRRQVCLRPPARPLRLRILAPTVRNPAVSISALGWIGLPRQAAGAERVSMFSFFFFNLLFCFTYYKAHFAGEMPITC